MDRILLKSDQFLGGPAEKPHKQRTINIGAMALFYTPFHAESSFEDL